MRAERWLPAVMTTLLAGVLVGLLTGCGGIHGLHQGPGMEGMKARSTASSGAMPTGRHTMPDGTVMGDGQRPHVSSRQADDRDGPSAAAAMVCTGETAGSVQKTFGLKALPRRTSTWSAPVYRCQYALAGGTVTLTVNDVDAAGPGTAWFDRLRDRLPAAKTLSGMQSLGFDGFETSRGDVVFLKDHKTLWVDASRVPQPELPPKFSRTDVAYHVAAAVLACWSE